MTRKNNGIDYEDFLKQLDRFRIVLKKNVSSKYQGARKTTIAGSGLTFKDYKSYVPGDDFRNLDWRVYARTNKLYVRRYEEERDLTVHIIVDASASMDFGVPSKYEYATLLGVGFAYLALKNNEKFDFSTFAEEMSPVRAKKGRKQLLALLEYLTQSRLDGKTAFQESLESARKSISSKSLVIIISDFLYEPASVQETLTRFRKSTVLCIQVLDKQEKHLSIQGDMILEDAEEKTTLRTFITRRVKKEYQESLETHLDKLRVACEQTRAGFVSVGTDEEIFDAFFSAYQKLR
ncbi:MAG: DUF58 domain-containing protein [Candidatus Woesearchaeota archaeon]